MRFLNAQAVARWTRARRSRDVGARRFRSRRRRGAGAGARDARVVRARVDRPGRDASTDVERSRAAHVWLEPMDAGDAASRHARAVADDHPNAPRLSRPARLSPRTAAGARAAATSRAAVPVARDRRLAPRLRRRPRGGRRRRGAEAAASPHFPLAALGDIPRLRCSACELTLRAVHAEAVSAARRPDRRRSPPPQTRETLVGANWNSVRRPRRDDATRVVGDTFTAGESYAEDGGRRGGKGRGTNGSIGNDIENLADANSPSSSRTRRRASSRRARCSASTREAPPDGNGRRLEYTFGAVEVREACVLVAGDATCRDRRGGEARSEL